jgi:16S rRNA (cytosine967-C5)-methyltransferase
VKNSNYIYSHLNSAKEILQQYKGEEPFASFIKKHFAQYKKFGSKDRKQISHLCYCYFRCPQASPPPKGGIAEESLLTEEKILTGLFLCSSEKIAALELLKPEWNERVHWPINEKLSFLNYPLSNIFSFPSELSDGIDREIFSRSHLIQPDLFIRIRPGHEKGVKEKLQKAGIHFNEISSSCLALLNNSKLDEILALNKEAVIQDYSSQRIEEFLKLTLNKKSQKVWDCCAASGGKSILAKDVLGTIDLAVSDVRESILANLEKRFKEAGIYQYKMFAADLTTYNLKLKTHSYDLIIADVPCSGSGTWGRTPEQLTFFDEKKIDECVALQKRVVNNVIPYLQQGGYLLYITCSVFKKENEEVVSFIKENAGLELIKMDILKGYDKKADTMFAALFTNLKPSF